MVRDRNHFNSQVTPGGQFLIAEINTSKSSHTDRWKAVTQYVVRIVAMGRSSSPWTVDRRYSKFYDLWSQLQKRFHDQDIPLIPPKRILGKEDPEFIRQRRQELCEFLDAILKKPVEVSLSEEVCLFLEVPEPLRVFFLESDTRSPTLISIPEAGTHAASFGGGAPDESRVTWLLKQLQDRSNNKVVSIRTFEDWILKTKPPLTEGNVKTLYLGLELQGGLVEEVGSFDHSEVSSIAALGLLCKLLSHETCEDAHVFRGVLKRLDQSILGRMRLRHHIHRNRGHSNRLDAFLVLRALEMAPENLMLVLQDEFALREFERWQEVLQSSLNFRTLHRRPAQARQRAPAIEPSGLLGRPVLTTHEYRKIAENAFTQVRMCLDTFVLPDDSARADSGSLTGSASTNRMLNVESSLSMSIGTLTANALDSYPDSEPPSPKRMPATMYADSEPPSPKRTPSVMSMSSPPPSPNRQNSLHSGHTRSNDILYDMLPEVTGPRSQQQWRHVPCPEPSWKTKYNLRAAYQRVPDEQQSDAYIARVNMKLPFPSLIVSCLLADHAEFIKTGLALKQDQLQQAVVEKLKHLADAHYISQLQSVHAVEPLQLGMPHVAHSELLECVLGTPTGTHGNLRTWLLRFIRILPVAAESSQTGLESPRGSSYLFACTAVPPVSGTDEGAFKGVSSDGRRGSDTVGSPRQRLVQLRPTGVLVSPAGEGQTELTLCAMLGKDSIRLVSGDLLGERLLFWKTLENIFFILEHLCPLPQDFTHSLLELERRDRHQALLADVAQLQVRLFADISDMKDLLDMDSLKSILEEQLCEVRSSLSKVFSHIRDLDATDSLTALRDVVNPRSLPKAGTAGLERYLDGIKESPAWTDIASSLENAMQVSDEVELQVEGDPTLNEEAKDRFELP